MSIFGPDEFGMTPSEQTSLQEASELLDAVRAGGVQDDRISRAIDLIDSVAGDPDDTMPSTVAANPVQTYGP